MGQGHLWPRKENPSLNNNYIIYAVYMAKHGGFEN